MNQNHTSPIVLLLAALAIVLSACAEGDSASKKACSGAGCGEPCAVDFDCPLGERCTDGFCGMGDGTPVCRADSDCSAGQVCVGGVCETFMEPDDGTCARNRDCPEGQLCDRDTLKCIDAPGCADDGDCLGDEACVEGVCTLVDEPEPEPDIPEPPADIPDPEPEPEPEPDVPEDVPTPPEDVPDPEPDAIEDIVEDVPEDIIEPEDTPDIIEDSGEDVIEDIIEDVAEDIVEDAPDPEPDTGPPPTPPRGVYSYSRVPVGGLREGVRALFHPDGTYAVILENRGGVHLFDWATQTATRLDPSPPGVSLYWQDIAFDPTGGFALLVAEAIDSDDASTGVIYRLDDAAYRAQENQETVLTRVPLTSPDPLTAIEYPPGPGHPVVLARRGRSPYVATLRGFDPDANDWTDFVTAQPTSAGCDDIAFVDNEFGLQPGIAVVCGLNGADVHFYTEIADVPQWRANPGNNNLGNTASISAHPSGDYALIVSFSGRAIYKIEFGQLNDYSDAPRYSRSGISTVRFQQNGQRALIVGRAGISPVRGTVVEFRHDEYDCPNVDSNCDLTEVSIPNFDSAPWNGDRNSRLNDAAFHPQCDGGLIVGGYTNFMGSTGIVARFQIDNGVACP